MKLKITQLMLLFLMVSLFSSSKENSVTSKAGCKMKCLQEIEPALQGGEKKAVTEEEVAEYPFALAPGSYMFRY